MSVCLTSVAYIRACAAGWRVLADRARLGQPGSRLPLRTSVAGLGVAYCGGRPPTACYYYYFYYYLQYLHTRSVHSFILTFRFRDAISPLVPHAFCFSIWNSLPFSIHVSLSLPTFKRQLKICYFQFVYSSPMCLRFLLYFGAMHII